MVTTGANDNDIVISYAITDNNSAPSQGVGIVITDYTLDEDLFDKPIRGGPVQRSLILNKGLNETVPGFYHIELTPFSSLGEGVATSINQFLNG